LFISAHTHTEAPSHEVHWK